jgi:hypothetical protein
MRARRSTQTRVSSLLGRSPSPARDAQKFRLSGPPLQRNPIVIPTVSGVKIPDSKLAREAAELVREYETEMLFNHSVRVYVFGVMKGVREQLVRP